MGYMGEDEYREAVERRLRDADQEHPRRVLWSTRLWSSDGTVSGHVFMPAFRPVPPVWSASDDAAFAAAYRAWEGT